MIDIGALDDIMDVEEASALWGLAPSYIKDLCRKKLVHEGKAVKKGKTWILDRNQPNPGQPQHPKNWRQMRKEKKDEGSKSGNIPEAYTRDDIL